MYDEKIIFVIVVIFTFFTFLAKIDFFILFESRAYQAS